MALKQWPRMLVVFVSCLIALPALRASQQVPNTQAELINHLIKRLGSEDFKTRDQATRRLDAMEQAYPALRSAMDSRDPEIKRRAELLVKSIGQRIEKRMRQRLIDSFWSGENLSIDELVDNVVWHKWDDEECWRVVLAFSRDLGARIGTKGTWREFGVSVSFLKSPCIVSDTWSDPRLDERRLVTNRVEANGVSERSVILCRGGFQNGDLYSSHLFANGDIKVKDRGGGGYIANSMIFCDGDVVAGRIVQSVIIATGSVKADSPPLKCFIIENARNPLPYLKLFSPSQAGIEVCPAKGGVRVEKVDGDKPFAMAGLRNGDLLLSMRESKDGPATDITSCDSFRRQIRRLFVQNGEATFRIQRGDKTLEVVVPLSQARQQ
jgi:hypothetical protein